jgi:hypothetical protein
VCPFAWTCFWQQICRFVASLLFLLLLLELTSSPPPHHQHLPITFITLSCLENYRLGLPYWSSSSRKISSRKLVGFFLASPFRALSFLGYFISSVLDLLVLSFLASPVTPPISSPLCLHSMRSNSPYRMWSLTFWSRRIKFELYILCKSASAWWDCG